MQDEVESFMLVFGAPMLAIVGYAVAELRFESFREDVPLDSVYKVCGCHEKGYRP